MQFTNEQMQKAKQAKTAQELLSIAKANGIELTEEQAKRYFAELHRDGELSDDELTAVVGGKDDEEEVQLPESKYKVGDKIKPSGKGTVIENSFLDGSCAVGAETIVSDIFLKDSVIPDRTAVCQRQRAALRHL